MAKCLITGSVCIAFKMSEECPDLVYLSATAVCLFLLLVSDLHTGSGDSVFVLGAFVVCVAGDGAVYLLPPLCSLLLLLLPCVRVGFF